MEPKTLTAAATLTVQPNPVRIPIKGREVSKIRLASYGVALELWSLNDPLTSTVDLFVIDELDVGRERRTGSGALGAAPRTSRSGQSAVSSAGG